MQKHYTLIFLLIALFSPLFADIGELELSPPSFIDSSNGLMGAPQLMINNRPLAKMNGKVISLYDVVKKMDLILYDYNPDFEPTPTEKHQYYMSRWEATLDELVNNELILLDADQKEIAVSDGEVRKELENRFGPNIMSNLDKVNLQYEEAREMIRNDLTVQQLIGMKVHSKAFLMITPQVVKGAYDDYLKKNPPEDEWTYQVLSIRGKDKDVCEALAAKACALLQDKTESLETIASEIQTEDAAVSLSEDYSGPTQKISKQHFDVIKELTTNSFSAPISQVSRVDQSIVHRIFHLKETVKKLPDSFSKMHDKIQNELRFKAADKEKEAYINILKKKFGYDVHNPKFDLPEDYYPFIIL